MIEAQAIAPAASLRAMPLHRSLRRQRPMLRLPPPATFGRAMPVAPPAGGWAADLRFFLTCYAAGFLFFLVMLS
jgi:hypothetical protein